MRSKFKWIYTLLLALTVQFSFAQEKTISGIVSDASGALPGVNVVIKGTTKGVSTGFDGSYSIKGKTGETLVFSYLGMQTTERVIGENNNINVTMKDNSEQLNEIVVTAVGIKRKPDEITTSNQIVKTKELTQASNPNALQSLAGKVSGLQVNTTSTGLNPNTSIVLRGSRSISGNNEALVVIDNIVSSASVLNSIDPNNIESVNVIKGANGAALYGERGATGVIIVTTKKGTKKDKISIDFSSSLTLEDIAYLPETQNRYGQGWRGDFDWTDQGSWGPEYDGSMQVIGIPYPSTTDWRFGKYEHIEDNIKPFFKTGSLLQNSLTISTGSTDTGYATLTGNKQEFKGIIPSDDRTKNFLSFSAGKKTGKFTLSAIARYTSDKTSRVNGNAYEKLSNTPSNIPVELFNTGDNGDHWTLYDDSPYWALNNDRSNLNNSISEILGEIQYDLNKNINLVARSSVRTTTGEVAQFTNEYIDLLQLTGTDRKIRSFYSQNSSVRRALYTDLLANFDYKLTENISFKSNLGMNLTEDKLKSMDSFGRDLSLANYYDLDNVSNVLNGRENKSIQKTAGIFGQIDLGYKDYLFLNSTARNDWNSVLKTKERKNTSFFYPSVGLAFIPTKAFPSIKGNILHKAKLSGSYVSVGNAGALNPHAINQTGVRALGFPYFLTPINSFVLGNTTVDPNIKNERVFSKEFNINLEFLNKRTPRITLDASASFADNKDQILRTTTSSTSGLFDALVNVGATKSTAYEVDLGLTPFKTDNFEWSTRLSYSTFKTIVKKVTDNSKVVGQGTPGIYAVEGEEFPIIRGTAYTRDGQGRIVIDTDGNPIKESQLKALGKTTPDYILNFSTEFKYKNITLTAVADYRTGHVFYSGVANQLNSVGRSIESAEQGRKAFLLPNSTVEGSNTTNTTVLTGGKNYSDFQDYVKDNYDYFSENFIFDATAFKLREVALNYDFSQKIISKIGLNKMAVGVSGRNLITVLPKSNRNYNDPETGNGLAGYSFTPPTRFITFNLNVAF